MRPRATACLAAVFAAALGGCGTVVNCINGSRPAALAIYGGVKQDAQNGSRHVTEAFADPAPCFSKIPKPPSAGRDFVARSFSAGWGASMLAVDLPVSVVADTLTLPLTVPATLMKQNPHAKQKAKPKIPTKPASVAPPKPQPQS